VKWRRPVNEMCRDGMDLHLWNFAAQTGRLRGEAILFRVQPSNCLICDSAGWVDFARRSRGRRNLARRRPSRVGFRCGADVMNIRIIHCQFGRRPTRTTMDRCRAPVIMERTDEVSHEHVLIGTANARTDLRLKACMTPFHLLMIICPSTVYYRKTRPPPTFQPRAIACS
jgi:hypothetical protein